MADTSPSNITNSCFQSRETQILTTTYIIIKVVLVLPLYGLVVFVGLQRRRLQRAGASVSHSDFFTYNMVGVEMISLLENMLSCSWIFTSSTSLILSSISIFIFSFTGQLYYHCLTCIERYVAVVFPIAYMNLRRRNAVRIIHIATGTGCLILAGCAMFILFYLCSIHLFFLFVLCVALTVVSFCSVSVLYVLKSPGPGAGDRADQTKQRAFYTIMAIMVAIWMWMMGELCCLVITAFAEFNENHLCLLLVLRSFSSLPSSLVLPLLFLHRAGKLPCFSSSAE